MSEGVTVVTGAVEGFDYGTGEIRSLVRRPGLRCLRLS